MTRISLLRTFINNGWTIANRRAVVSKIGKENFKEISILANNSNLGGDVFEYQCAKQFLKPSTVETSKEALKINFQESLNIIKREIENFKQLLQKKPKNKMTVQDGINDVSTLKSALISMHTEYDTKNIILARLKSLVAGHLKISSSKLEKDSTTINILSKFSEKIMKADKQKQLVIISGGAASGKNTLIESKEYVKRNYLLADADIIKRDLPGNKEFGAGFVHTLSSSLTRAELSAAIEEGCNIVYPTTGITSIRDVILKAKQNGYKDIMVIHCDAPKDIRAKRVIERFNLEGRFVDPYYIQDSQESLINDLCKELSIKLEKYISV